MAVAIGPLAIRWYGLAYLAGFLFAAIVMWRLQRRWGLDLLLDDLVSIMTGIMTGVILGGRLGYVLFYG
ncbi:MAG: prolipoprotein diacylglyceryl transferase, partial [Coriobacteriales bacterium]|nr:prolipoprotein diacylglyceryl transferase [Coriobacteriales bacterium]